MSINRNTRVAIWLLIAGVAQAANITWDVPADYSAPSDVRTDNVLVEAYNATGIVGAASPTINGVTFVANTTLLDNDATTDFLSGDTGDVAYNQFLNSLDYGSSGTLSIGGGQLEVGKDYLVQAWYVDERSSSDAREMQFGDGNGNLSAGVNDQYVTGTFTADGSSQPLIVYGVTSGPHFTGYQLRDLSSPIPTLSSGAGSTVSSSFSVTVDFSESVSGLSAGDFTTLNCSISNVSGSGASWSITVNPSGNGDVEVTLPVDTVLDGDSHGNVASNTILTTYVAPGSEQPVPTLSTTATDVTGDYTVDINFNESVTGLELSDFDVTSGTVSNLVGSGSSYSVTVSPNFGGDVTISLPRNKVTDTDGDVLQNVESNTLTNAYFITVTVNTPEQLLPYLVQDNVTATLTPGTYTIDADDVRNTYGTPRFEFWGNNSTYDFTDVTINFAADIYDDGLSMSHMQVFGNNNVLKNLRMIDLCDKYGTAGKSGGVNLIMDGEYNRVEGFYFEIRGSYPYGYGDSFGKGGTYTIKHWKHSGLLVRGNYNHVLNCTLMQESYGHCIFMQAASNPIIEGCYVEGEVRSTDDMLAETSGPAFDIGFMTVWGFTLPAGFMKSTTEAGIRAYNAGNTYVNGVWYSRGTSNPTIIDNTLVNTRVGVTLTHASGFKYVEGCTAIGTERGYAIGSGVIKNCFSDVQHGPAFGVDYSNDSGVTADITILPHTGAHYNGTDHIAYIQGSNHNLTFRSTVQNPEQDLIVTVGGDFNHISSSQSVESNPANNMIINNLTGYPMVVDSNTSGIDGQSIGSLTDSGASTNVSARTWDVLNNLAFLGTATQSSDTYDTIASIATDQNTDGDFGNGSVTHTNNEAQPWWKIDLEGVYDISEIVIWNRTNSSASSRLSDFDVTIFDSDEQQVWTSYQANEPTPSVSLMPNTSGQFVLIQLRGTNPLSLAEVEIFGAVVDGPGNLTADSSSGDIVLSWDSVADATGYTVKRATTSGGPYTTIGNPTGLTYTDTTALDSTFYYYVVTATVNGSETGASNEVSSIIGSAPAKFVIGSGDVTASDFQQGRDPFYTVDGDFGTRWSANGDGQWIRYDLGAEMNVHSLKIGFLSSDSRVATFHIETSNDDSTWTALTGNIDSSGTTPTNELETFNVTPTLARYVRIVGHGNSSSGWNSYTEVEIWGTLPQLAPDVPTNLAAAPSDGEVGLSWTVSAGATQHHVKRSTTDGSGYSTIASVAGGAYTDTSAVNDTTYYYVVSAENGSGESADSTQVSATPIAPPATPADLVATPGDGEVSLIWTPSTGATQHHVKRSTTDGSGYTTIASVAGGTYTDTSAVNDTTYYYVVSAENGSGESADSTQVSATPIAPPATPAGLAATPGDDEVSLSWAPSTGATQHHVKRSTTDGSGYSTIASVAGGAYTDTSAANDTTYYYVISAENGSGESADSTQVSATPIAPPATPAGLAATPGDDEVSLSWTPSTGATQHHVKRSTTDGSGYTTIASVAGGTYVDTTAVNDTAYYYVVSAENGSGESADSTQVSATPIAPPATPAGLAATPGDDEVSLSWTPSTGATQHHVKRSTTDGSGYSTIASVAGGSYVDTTAANGTTYYYVVSAENGSGESDDSAQVSATPIAPPATPVDLAATAGDDEVSLSWKVSDGATQHHVKRSTIDGSGYTTIASVAGGSYVDTAAVNDTTYYYVVSAENGSGESADSTQVSATPIAPPATPADLAATPGDGEVSLSWTPSTGATQHHLKRSSTEGSGYSTIASVAGGSYVDSSVINGTYYYYVVSAENGSGESSDSSEVSAKPFAPISPDELLMSVGVRSGDDMEFTIDSIPGRIYQLQSRESLVLGDWANVGDPVVGTGGSILLEDVDAFQVPTCFYRVQIQP